MKHFKSSNQIGLFFVYLNSFQIGVKIKNCPLHRDWNSNGRSKRQVRWPLPRPTISSKAVKKPRSASSKMGLIKFANSDNWRTPPQKLILMWKLSVTAKKVLQNWSQITIHFSMTTPTIWLPSWAWRPTWSRSRGPMTVSKDQALGVGRMIVCYYKQGPH